MKSIRLRPSTRTPSNAGNAMLFVLLGIVLFAALTYTFTRTSRSAAKLSFEEARLNAQQILSFAQKVNGAVEGVSMQNGCLASQINFENTTIAGYANAGSPANNKCDVFDSAGGGVRYEAPPAVALDTTAAATAAGSYAAGNLIGEYLFTGNVCVDGVGTGQLASGGRSPVSCTGDAQDDEELLLILPWVKSEVCVEINRILNNSAAMLVDLGGSFDDTKFTGSYAEGYAIANVAYTTYPSGCYQSGGADSPGAGYHFYYALLAR